MDPDLSLVHCVELTCPECGYMTRVARCHRNSYNGYTNFLVEDYRLFILSHGLHCPNCKNKYEDRSVAIVRGEVMEPNDHSLVHCVELTCLECGHITRVARCRAPLDAERLIGLFHADIQMYGYCLHCPECNNKYDTESIAMVTRPVEVM